MVEEQKKNPVSFRESNLIYRRVNSTLDSCDTFSNCCAQMICAKLCSCTKSYPALPPRALKGSIYRDGNGNRSLKVCFQQKFCLFSDDAFRGCRETAAHHGVRRIFAGWSEHSCIDTSRGSSCCVYRGLCST